MPPLPRHPDGDQLRRQARDSFTGEARDLVDAQYADRPQLRPVLDAILAALPDIGEVTLQARRTCVSIVGPRRVFAAVQPTTKSRVDLGLRLEGVTPAGRLLVAR